MKAMLLAAGHGSRLGDIGLQIPKPLLPVLNCPTIEFSSLTLRQAGFTQVAVNTHHLRHLFSNYLKANRQGDQQIRLFEEEHLLGTAGGISAAFSYLFSEGEDAVLIMNAKLIYRPPIDLLVQTHTDRQAFATMVLRPAPPTGRYGRIQMNTEQQVVSILGQRGRSKDIGTDQDYMFTGVQVLSRDAAEQLPDQGCVVRQGYLPWLALGKKISAVVDHSPWFEVSTPKAYWNTNMQLLANRMSWDHLGSIDRYNNCIAKGATIEGTQLRNTVVGSGAFICPGCRIERSVIWPGQRVDHDICDSVVTDKGIISMQTQK